MEECQVCKARLCVLTDYHCQLHGLTKEEYREKYGVVKARNNFSIPKRHYSEAELYEINKLRKKQ